MATIVHQGIENHKNIFLILSKGPADGINGINSVGEPEKSFESTLSKTEFCLSL